MNMHGLRIGWHTWEPGLTGNPLTSGGGAEWASYLFRKLKESGHKIYWLPNDFEAPQNTTFGTIDQCDVALFCWRWEMPERPERHAYYLNQMKLIAEAVHHKIPIIIHDQDHKISMVDWNYLKSIGAVITSPEMFPRNGATTLMFPNPYLDRTDFKQLAFPTVRDWDLVYIGNNYERYEQAVRMMRSLSLTHNVAVWGNWLEKGPDREDPIKVRTDLRKVHFCGRLPQPQVIKELSNGLFSVHLFKPSYGPVGFVTIRWAEAVMAKTPSFIPSEFRLPEEWKVAFHDLGLVVKSGVEIEERIDSLSTSEWIQSVEAQMDFVNQFMRLTPWFSIFREVA